MPLITSVGLSNERKGFPVALSYCPGETTESYSYFFEVLNTAIFTDSIPPPRVVLTDAAAGMLSAAKSGVFNSNTTHQLCNWHVANAMIARIRKGGYKSTEMDGETIENREIPGIKDLIWRYIMSMDSTLANNRCCLLDVLRPKEQEYLKEYWQSKEQQFVACFTAKYANLGAHSTQQNEVLHSTLTKVTHGQMSLEQSARALCQQIKDIYERLYVVESTSMTKQPTGLQTAHFKELRGKISLFAIRRIEIEYLALSQLQDLEIFSLYNLSDHYTSCECENRLRYSLPCRHILIPFAREKMNSIPITLIHPRWELKPRHSDRWLIAPTDWTPFYTTTPKTLLLSPKKADAYTDLSKILQVCDTLPLEERNRYTRQIADSLKNLQHIGERHTKLASIPIGQPDIIPKRTFKRKRPTENSRGLTANEIGEKEQQQQQSRERIEARDRLIDKQHSEETIVVAIPTSCTHDNASTSLSARPLSRSPTPTPSTELPPSTAPPRISRTGRTIKKTERKEKAQAAGWLPDSQR